MEVGKDANCCPMLYKLWNQTTVAFWIHCAPSYNPPLKPCFQDEQLADSFPQFNRLVSTFSIVAFLIEILQQVFSISTAWHDYLSLECRWVRVNGMVASTRGRNICGVEMEMIHRCPRIKKRARAD